MTKRMWMALVSLLGLFLGAYLTLYKFGFVGTLACSVSSCEQVQTSRWSVFLGIPVATWGLLFTAWLNDLEAFVIHAWCEWCLGSAAMVAVLFVLAALDWRETRDLA